MIGQTVSHYRIVDQIGEGGMGVVYLAEDLHLARQVAIKFLSDAQDHNYRSRFLREARAISSLSHPNIAVIHDYGESSAGLPFIVMEYIKGSTLNQLLERSELTISRALEIIEAVAAALGAAHARGIIHRDIKPSNVLVDEQGQVKVLDFGLVKHLHDDNAAGANLDAATLPVLRTASNVVVGTPLYLSPEQAMGTDVDARSDIFALGALLYESLTGKPAFSGGSVIEIGGQIIHVDPPLPSTINHRVPGELDRITLKALAKNPDARYQSAAEMLADLRPARAGLSSAAGYQTQRLEVAAGSHSSAFESITETLRRPRISIGVFALALLVVAVIGWAIFKWTRSSSSEPFGSIAMTKVTSSGRTVDACISPDGKYLADVIDDGGKQSLWLRQIDVPAAGKQIVPPTESQYEGLTFSRDGKYLYYLVWENNARDVLYRVPVLGDSPRKLSLEVNSPVGFSPDGRSLAFIRRDINQGESSVIIANEDGTGERTLAKRKEPNFFAPFAPAWSPDGKFLACAVRSSAGGFQASVAQVRLSDGAETPLTSRIWALVEKVIYLKDDRGLLLTAAEQTSGPFQIWHIANPETAPRRITTDLNSYVGLSMSEDSSKLLTVQSDRLSSVFVATGTDPTQTTQVTSVASQYYGVAWAPDGRIVFGSVTNGNPDIWIMDASGGGQKQLTSGSSVERDPTVSPDGRYILFSSNQAGRFNVWRMDLTGENPKQLTNGDDEAFPQCSPDGQWVVYQGFVNGIPALWRTSIDGGNPKQLTFKYSNWPAISPDGKMIACSYLNDSGQWRLTLIPAEGGQPQGSFEMSIPYLQHFAWQRIRWTPDGKGIAYINNRGGISNIRSQPLAGGPPQNLTDFKVDQIFNFAWSADGKALAYLRGIIRSDVVLITEGK